MEKTTEKNPVEEELYIEPNPTEEEVEEQIEVIEKVNKAMEEAERIAKQTIIHKWFKEDDEKQKMVQYAYELWGIDFVKTIECENGNWNIWVVWDGGKAFGLCQINVNYHRLPEWYKTDWKIQVEFCYEKWKWGTKFYWPSRIIKGKKCANYVSDRFIIK